MTEGDPRAAFLDLAERYGVLRFGDFVLKSGRRSPYFFDAGAFDDARAVEALGSAYARRIVEAGIAFDVLFGPAYKGIPLAVATAFALARDHGRNCGVAYNRKEAKDHGEGGLLVGAAPAGRVVLVDDVMTAGTAVRESLPLIEGAGGRLVAVITALDRMERGRGEQSTLAELAEEFAVPILAIVDLDDLAARLAAVGRDEQLAALAAYRAEWGAKEPLSR